MASGTPRRGNTIAEKIAQFRAVGSEASTQRTTKDEEFWWQQPSSRAEISWPRPDAASQLATGQFPVSSPGSRSRSRQPQSDARYQGIDQSQSRTTLQPAELSGATVAAWQRLAQDHPTLYHAVISLERGADGRLSNDALQTANQALVRSMVTSHGSDTAPFISRHEAGRTATAPTVATPVGHTTTTIVPQPSQLRSPWQQMRDEVQARAQAALAAAAGRAKTVTGASGSQVRTAGTHESEESVDQLLARYRSAEIRLPAGDKPAAAAASDRRSSRGSGGGVSINAMTSDVAQEPVETQRLDAPGTASAGSSSGGGAIAAVAAVASGGGFTGASHAEQRSSSSQVLTEQAPWQGTLPANPNEVSGAAVRPAEAGAPYASSRKPSAEKLQKILKLANMAIRMSGSNPDGSRAPDAINDAPAADSVPAAVGVRESSSGAGSSRPHPESQPPAKHPAGAQPDESGLRRSRHGSVSSLAGDLAGEPSLSSLHAQPNIGGPRRASAPEIRADVERTETPRVVVPQRKATPETEAAAAKTDQPGSRANTAVAEFPALATNPSQEGSAAATADEGASVGSSGAAAGAVAAAPITDAVADPNSAAGFAFPVSAGTSVDSTGLLSRAVTTDSAAASSSSASAIAAAAARRVQFSPNEPQVRLYSEVTGETATIPAGQQTGGASTAPGAQAMSAPSTPPGVLQPVVLLRSPTPPDDPDAPRPTHIFIPANPILPPALVSVPGFEPLPSGSLKQPQRRHPSPGGSNVSPPRRGRRSKSSSGSPTSRDSATGAAPAETAVKQAGSSGDGAAATASATGKQRSEVDRVLDSDSDSDTGIAGGRILADMALEVRAAEQAAAQVEREATVHTPNRLTRLLDQVATFRRTEGERLLREGERLKMVEELKTMNVDQLAALLGPTSELLKEISKFRDLYTGNLEIVKATADEHTRVVLEALQRTSDTAQAVKEAVVESALRQQDEVLEMVDRIAPPAPPPPSPRSSLLSLPAQTLYGGIPAASDLLNPTWWTRLIDPANRASLSGSVAAAANVAGVDVPTADMSEGLPPQAAAGDLLAHQVAGLASAIRTSLDHQTGGGALHDDLSVSAITRAARQVSMTLDMAVREYINRTTHATPPSGVMYPLGTGSHSLSPGLPLGQQPDSSLGIGRGVGTGQADPWVVQPVVVPPVVLPNGSVVAQPLTGTAVLPPSGPSVGTGSQMQLVASNMAAVAPSSVPQIMVAQGVSPGSVTPAAIPQLVAVHGPLPSSGASGTALLNLPSCGPALVVGNPVDGMIPAGSMPRSLAQPLLQVPRQSNGMAAAVAQAHSAAVQPGEGLPCRLDLQMVRILSPSPPGMQLAQQQSNEMSHQQSLEHQQQQLRELQELPVYLNHADGTRPHGHADSCVLDIGRPVRVWPLGSSPATSGGQPQGANQRIGNECEGLQREVLPELSAMDTSGLDPEAVSKIYGRLATGSSAAQSGLQRRETSPSLAQSSSTLLSPRSTHSTARRSVGTYKDRTPSPSRSRSRRNCSRDRDGSSSSTSSSYSTSGDSPDGRRSSSRTPRNPNAVRRYRRPTVSITERGSRRLAGAERPKRRVSYDSLESDSQKVVCCARRLGRPPGTPRLGISKRGDAPPPAVSNVGSTVREQDHRKSRRYSSATVKGPDFPCSVGGGSNDNGIVAGGRGIHGRVRSVAGSEPSLASGIAELTLVGPSSSPIGKIRTLGSACETWTGKQQQPHLPSQKYESSATMHVNAMLGPAHGMLSASPAFPASSYGASLIPQAQDQGTRLQHVPQVQEPPAHAAVINYARGYQAQRHYDPQQVCPSRPQGDSSSCYLNPDQDSGAGNRNETSTERNPGAWVDSVVGTISNTGGPQQGRDAAAKSPGAHHTCSQDGAVMKHMQNSFLRPGAAQDVSGSQPSTSNSAAGGDANKAEAPCEPVFLQRENSMEMMTRSNVARPLFSQPSSDIAASGSALHLQQGHLLTSDQVASMSSALHGTVRDAAFPSGQRHVIIPAALVAATPTFVPTSTSVGYTAAAELSSHPAIPATAGPQMPPYSVPVSYLQSPTYIHRQQYQNQNHCVHTQPKELQSQPHSQQLPQRHQLPMQQEGHSQPGTPWRVEPMCVTMGAAGTYMPSFSSPPPRSLTSTGTYPYLQSPPQLLPQQQALPTQISNNHDHDQQQQLLSSASLQKFQRQKLALNRELGPNPLQVLPAVPSVTSLTSRSEDMQHAYQATLAQLQAVYNGKGQG